jgi:hypothetical protein
MSSPDPKHDLPVGRTNACGMALLSHFPTEVPFAGVREVRAMEQKIEALTPYDLARMEKQRVWVRDHYDVVARNQYDTVEGKLRLLDTIIRSKWIEPSETWKLQSLGITFGDALAQELGLIWVAVEDEHGRDPALRDKGTSIVMFPMTTLSKRIERGETVDVCTLFGAACESVARLRSELKGR